MDEETTEWVAKQDARTLEGKRIVERASNEALEYAKDAVENMGDRAWRKMVVETQAIEMGIGIGIAEHLVPVIYTDMTKSLHKKIKLDKNLAMAVRHIYMGRVIKNIIKEMEDGRA